MIFLGDYQSENNDSDMITIAIYQAFYKCERYDSAINITCSSQLLSYSGQDYRSHGLGVEVDLVVDR